MFTPFVLSILYLPLILADAAPSFDALCIAGQCLQGSFSLSVGAGLTASSTSRILLLPDQYTASNTPQLVLNALNSATPTPLLGFNLSSSTLPFTVSVESGLLAFSDANYQTLVATVTPATGSISQVNATDLQAGSIVLASSMWAAVGSQVGNVEQRLVLWNSAPDLTQFPSGVVGSELKLLDIQFATCSPPCSGAGTCTLEGSCACPTGFTGASCETCETSFFGPSCLPCAADCSACDDGPTGSGLCLSAPAQNLSTSCNCLNGVCLSNGQCQCNPGWGSSLNGTACAACATGFFLDAAGQCEVCQLGCVACSSGSGICTACQSGLSLDPSDNSRCIPSTQLVSQTSCVDGSFWNGTACAACSTLCETCDGPLSTNCIICGVGRFSLNGTCVSVSNDGVCSQSFSTTGGTLVANNGKSECDACPSKCTKCSIPGYNVASSFTQVQCSACLPGFVLSGGQCVSQCPTGTYVSPSDNLTCVACDSACSTCAGSASFCLSCSSSSQHALNGTCTSTCPAGTFTSGGSCLACHADCASCSASGFSECTSCRSTRPVLQGTGSGSGRCLPTCAQNQYFATATSNCETCDTSCASCTGPGPSSCLACSSTTAVLRGGACVPSQCLSGSGVIVSLGTCLSDLGSVPSNTSVAASPTPGGTNSSSMQSLPWWQILLMALGGAFILLLVAILWRRYQRRKRALETMEFAHDMDRKRWRQRMREFIGLNRERPSTLPPYRSRRDVIDDWELQKLSPEASRSRDDLPYITRRRPASVDSRTSCQLSASSQAGRSEARSTRYPEPRQPIRDQSVHRFSATSSSFYASTVSRSPSPEPPLERSQTPRTLPRKQPKYPPGFSPDDSSQWLTPTATGGSVTNNPFRR